MADNRFDIEVFRVLADPDAEMDYDGRLLGVGVDMPESEVYVDWRREAFPDELDDPHVSVYGSVEDLQKATGNDVEYIDSEDVATEDLLTDAADAVDDTSEHAAAPVAASEWSVRELDGIAAEMDLLSRAEPEPGRVVWRSADDEIAYCADLPEKYADALDREAFIPPEEVAQAAGAALDEHSEHPDEVAAAGVRDEDRRRARQLVRHHDQQTPLPPEYVVEIDAFLDTEASADTAVAFFWGGPAAAEWTDDLVTQMAAVDGAHATADVTANGPAAPVTQASTAAAAGGDDAGPELGDITKEDSNEIDVDALPDEYQAALEADDFYIYGRASIQQYDRAEKGDRLKIEMDALEDALDRYFDSEKAPGIISMYHADIPVGVPERELELDEPTTLQLESPEGDVEEYEFDAGEKLRSHVGDTDDDGRPELWLLSNIANDSEMAKQARLRALVGDYNGYSVTIHRNDDTATEEGKVAERVDLHATTLGTADGVKNAGSTFDVAEYQAFTDAA